MNDKSVECLNVDTHIPNEVRLLLSLGPKFAIPLPVTPSNAKQLLNAISTLNRFQFAVYECRTLNAMAKSFLSNITGSPPERSLQQFMTHVYNCTLKFFFENDSLMFAQADKGKVTVILEKENYVAKMNDLLLDRNTYTLINVSAHNSFNIQNQKLLHRLAHHGLVSESAISTILANEQRIANMYGLIKLHKPSTPARPVVNTQSTPGYTIAKCITSILTQAKDNHKYNIMNTKHLLQKLGHIETEPADVFVTVDIRDMFTNITTQMAIKSVRKRYQQQKITQEIPLQLIIDCITFVTQFATEIEFNGLLYKQIRGLRMGGSLSTILADFVVEDILDDTFTHVQRPKIMAKYVDDCLMLGKRRALDAIIYALNKPENQLQFLATDEDIFSRIVYLDLQLHNMHGFNDVVSSWYSKPMASGRLLNFHSTHPKSTIENTAKSYVRHMLATTHTSLWSDMLKRAEHILALNSFPNAKINAIINQSKVRVSAEMRHVVNPLLVPISSNKSLTRLSQSSSTSSPSSSQAQPHEKHSGSSPPASQWIYTHNTDGPEHPNLRSWDQTDPYDMEWLRPKEHFKYISLPYIPNVTPHIAKEIKLLKPGTMAIGSPINTMRTLNNQHKNLIANRGKPKYANPNTDR